MINTSFWKIRKIVNQVFPTLFMKFTWPVRGVTARGVTPRTFLLAQGMCLIALKGNGWVMTYTTDPFRKKISQNLAFMMF